MSTPATTIQQKTLRKTLIPRKTDPEAKFIRTGEGVLVFAFNVAMLVVPIVSNALSATEAVKWAAILNGVAVVSRSGLKIADLLPSVTGVKAANVGPEVAQGAADLIAKTVVQAINDSGQRPSLEAIGTQVNADLDAAVQVVNDAENGAQAVEDPAAVVAQAAMDTPGSAVAAAPVNTPTETAVQPALDALQPTPSTAALDAPVEAAAPNTPLSGDTLDPVSDSEEFASVPSEVDLVASADGSPGAAPAMAAGNPATANGGGH
jgi:uncharacterized protein YqgV (UPF0045/DUF77 family)